MAKVTKKKRLTGASTTRSTAGPGFDFEDQVAAWLLVKMLTGETIPGMDQGLGLRLQSQTGALGWRIDDLLVTCGPDTEPAQLAISCKSNLQVTGNRLPDDFVKDAWQQYNNDETGPLYRGRDRMALVTRGHHPSFQATWADIKNACTSDDPALALARIQATDKHRTIFDNIKNAIEETGADVQDEELLQFIGHLLVIPKDFQLDPSEDQARALAQCRQVLVSAASDEAQTLWNSLLAHACDARLGDGTIDLVQLWHSLRHQFRLNDHPNYASGWALLKRYTDDHLNKIETALPSDYSLLRSEDRGKLVQALSSHQLVVLYGDSGAGKSALAKSTLGGHFVESSQLWLGPDTLSATLNEVERSHTDLTYSLSDTLKASAHSNNILVIDAAERISRELVPQVKQFVNALLSGHPPGQVSMWRILIIGQTEAWIDGRLQALLGDRQAIAVGVESISIADVQTALQTIPQLNWLTLQDDTLPVLTNLRALAWIMQAASQFQQQEYRAGLSLTMIADSLWQFWTNGELTLQGILMRLGQREASFEHSIGLSTLATAEAQALQERPAQLPVRITSQNRIEFQHDLAAEWARFQYLKEIADDTTQWALLANNPLWAGAIRMLGQFLLREHVNDRCAWDIAFETLDGSEQGSGLAIDLLLDALCLDPLAEILLTERSELLFANHGAPLKRLLRRFQHIASVPSGQLPVPNLDPDLSLYIEAQNRVPIIGRWPPVIRFLSTHRERVAELMSPVIAKLCERWLTTMPVELIEGVPTPLRKELAEIALATARALQVTQGKGVLIIADELEKPIYTAALAGAPDLPNEVSAWALEMAQRRPWHADVVRPITEYRRQRAEEHRERLRTDPEYRAQQERRENLPVHIPSARELPPWPLGPQQRVEKDFQECCSRTHALAPLMRTRADVASEVLLAVLIEDSPEEPYDPHRSLHDELGLQFDHGSYPTAFWKSPFYGFLQIAPETGLETLISLVNFCTERWDQERQRHVTDPITIALNLPDGKTKEYTGNHRVLDWGHTSSTRAGQLHSALAALEKWLCDDVDKEADITPHIQRLFERSESVAILGVLINVGKYRHELFEGPLRPLLSHQALYFWDEARLRESEFRFDAMAWARQGETIFQMAREWQTASYRKEPLRRIAAQLVAFKPEIGAYLGTVITQWQLPEDDKAALDLRQLQALLDYNNYQDDPEGTEGERLFEYPLSLQRDYERYHNTTEPTLRTVTLPQECIELIGHAEELSPEKAEELTGFLDIDLSGQESDISEDEQDQARIAVAATLLTRARSWLNDHPDSRDTANAMIQTVIDQIGNDTELLRGRIRGSKSELEFAGFAVMHEFIHSQTAPDGGSGVLRVLTSGSAAALSTMISLAYLHREQLNGTWWRLLELSLYWSALTILAPRPDEPQELHQQWARWLHWLRTRSLTTTDASLARIVPLSIARRVERLQRQRWRREFEQENNQFMRDPSDRRSPGLDTQFLKATFGWLLQSPSAEAQASDTTDDEQRIVLLKGLLDFELWPHHDRRDDDRNEPSSDFAYDVIEVIANVIPNMSVEAGRELWQPIFRLGGNSHYILGHFIDCWLVTVSKNAHVTAFAPHWQKMIEYALFHSQWTTGRRWYYGERLLCRLLGCGSELSLDQVAELQAVVLQMKDLYEIWADQHLSREEDNITYFCGFISSSTGRLLRIEGIQWLHRSIHQQGTDNLHWRRSGTANAMVGLLDILLQKDVDKLTTSATARDAFLELVAVLVKLQIDAALALQERARVKLS
jgi:hypothetical protein